MPTRRSTGCNSRCSMTLPTTPSDLIFENVQARIRTLLLMSRGFVLGTGDMSEQALGWCTYNGDHMSMYNVNTSIPKTLVRFLVRYAADHYFEGRRARAVASDRRYADLARAVAACGAMARSAKRPKRRSGPTNCMIFSCTTSFAMDFAARRFCYLAGHAKFSASRYDRTTIAADAGEFLSSDSSPTSSNGTAFPTGPKSVRSVSRREAIGECPATPTRMRFVNDRFVDMAVRRD